MSSTLHFGIHLIRMRTELAHVSSTPNLKGEGATEMAMQIDANG
jgi:hypothetical protein